jgi:hypothetical protein
MNNSFTTLDAYLAGYLSLKGFMPELIQQGPKVVFSFKDTPDLNQAISAYNAGEEVEAFRFVMSVKTLKSRIFSLRKNKDTYHGPETKR